jgi:hypothetical protein
LIGEYDGTSTQKVCGRHGSLAIGLQAEDSDGIIGTADHEGLGGNGNHATGIGTAGLFDRTFFDSEDLHPER